MTFEIRDSIEIRPVQYVNVCQHHSKLMRAEKYRVQFLFKFSKIIDLETKTCGAGNTDVVVMVSYGFVNTWNGVAQKETVNKT